MVVVEFAMIHGLVMTTCYMTTFYNDYDFFSRIRPTGESLHQKCGARRGEVDSSTPEVSGGF